MKVSKTPACVTSESSLFHTFDALITSTYAHDPRLARLNELSTTPDNTNGEDGFTITHPFHPLWGQTFPLLAQRFAWGEERVFFADPHTHQVRSLPLAGRISPYLILFSLWLMGKLCYVGVT